MDERDVRVDTYSTLHSATARAVHLPTGLVAESGEHRSQWSARREALERLRERVERQEALDEVREHP